MILISVKTMVRFFSGQTYSLPREFIVEVVGSNSDEGGESDEEEAEASGSKAGSKSQSKSKSGSGSGSKSKSGGGGRKKHFAIPLNTGTYTA